MLRQTVLERKYMTAVMQVISESVVPSSTDQKKKKKSETVKDQVCVFWERLRKWSSLKVGSLVRKGSTRLSWTIRSSNTITFTVNIARKANALPSHTQHRKIPVLLLFSLSCGLTLGQNHSYQASKILSSLSFGTTIGQHHSYQAFKLLSSPLCGLTLGQNHSYQASKILSSLSFGLTLGQNHSYQASKILSSFSFGLTHGQNHSYQAFKTLSSLSRGLVLGQNHSYQAFKTHKFTLMWPCTRSKSLLSSI